MKIVEIDYRFSAVIDTPRYLNQLSALDQEKAAAFRAWARLRAQLARIKLLVLGTEDE